MSSHFNYEIEERNMRNQLKALDMPFKEEAWASYETYAKQFQSAHKTQFLPNFNLALNRTVVLPVVFGAIIVLFSFLLFNFINIKNTKTVNKEGVEEKPLVQSTTVEKKELETQKEITTPIVNKEETPLIKNEVVTNTVTSVVIHTPAIVAKTIPPVVNYTVAVKPVATSATAIDQNTHITKSTPTYTFEPKKKKRKNRSAEVLESIATPVSLPNLNQEEAEPELR